MAKLITLIFKATLTLLSVLGLVVLANALIIVNTSGVLAEMTPSGDYKVEFVPAYPMLVGWEQAYVRFTEVAHPENVYRSPITFDGSIDMGSIGDQGDLIIMFPFFFNRRTKHFSTDDAGAARGRLMSIFTSNAPTDVGY
jgi:hypothetical protein